MVRILALTNLYPSPRQPGRAPFNRQLFRALAAKHALRVIAPIAWTDELSRWWGGEAKDFQVSHDIPIDHPRYLFPPKILRRWYGQFFVRSVRRSFERALNEFRPDVIYGSWAYPDGFAAVKLGHEAGLPVIVRVHGSDIYLLDQHPSRKRRTREALQAADIVIAPSSDLAKCVVDLGVDAIRVRVVYNGVDTKLFHPASKLDARRRLGLPLNEKIVLFIGNLVPVKGIDVLIDACDRMKAASIPFRCHVLGEGALRSKFERQIRELNLHQHLFLSGSKPHAELPDWYRAADLLVLPSHSEGLPNVLLEAMACGTRFVASDLDGIREIASQGNGTLVRPGNASGLAAAICDELSNPAIPAAHGQRSFDDSASELSDILHRVVEAHGRSHQKADNESELFPIGESR